MSPRDERRVASGALSLSLFGSHILAQLPGIAVFDYREGQ
jgi:hypothetical protein